MAHGEVCGQLEGIWQWRLHVVHAARSNSWRQVIQAIQKVPNYGGTGFLAKELAQDLLHTPLPSP